MAPFEEVSLRMCHGDHSAVVVLHVFADRALIVAINRGPEPPLFAHAEFTSQSAALEAAREIWIACLIAEDAA